MKYYVFLFWDRKGSGKRFILADSEESARKRLRRYLHDRHPFRKFWTKLEQVLPA